MTRRNRPINARLLCGAAAIAILASAGVARAADAKYDIPPQPLDSALREFGVQSGVTILADAAVTLAKQSPGISATADPDTALRQILEGTGLAYRRDGDVFVVQGGEGSGPQGGSAGDVDALIVTAQKREENIQDVPIAISAFSQEALERSQIAGGPDLITQIPNMTFTKTNFSSYSIQIRGIGTQAVSATTDAAVAVAMNNTSFIRNRFFEQEFYDLERVEVLRGPQGTLYGRNATAGAVNVITAKPKFTYSAKASADAANYSSTRIEGMVNIPLVEDVAALRMAGAWTTRDGYATNEITGAQIDGRDLWSTRLSLRVAPTDAIDVNLIWEHFQEDDDRLRSGKQVCKRDDRGFVGLHKLPGKASKYSDMFNQGCLSESLFAPQSFQATNGFSLPYYHPLGALFLPTFRDLDPYARTTQSRDLRVIESTVDPEYRARSDVAEFQVGIDLSDALTLTSETGYSADTLFSKQDFNRFNTSSGAFANLDSRVTRAGILTPGPNGNVFCDPQIGCADRLVAVDLSTAKSRQFSQEFRVSSDFDGPVNFSLGGNFLRYDTEDKYYVFINTLTLYSTIGNLNAKWPGGVIPPWIPGESDNLGCLKEGPVFPDLTRPQPVTGCVYIDPNPIGSLNDKGHNYFLSKNPYKLISYAGFGEIYYNITPDLKLTGGLRVTVDKKEAPRIPSWLLAAESVGFPVAEVIEQEWTEPTGRLALDWKPHLSFTDDTLLYASFAHGYKAGGANPPGTGIVTYAPQIDSSAVVANGLIAQSATHPKTFAPEFVNAFELGSKNTLFDGRLTLNVAAFYYDYKGYQISYIVDRSAVNLNFDADIWGLELEADWRPLDNLKIGLKGGYENTRVADGSQAIDLMDRTAGHVGPDGQPDWLVVRPFPSYPSNCILPVYVFATTPTAPLTVNNNYFANGQPGPCEFAYVLNRDPLTGLTYVANPTVQDSAFGSLYPGYTGFDPLTAPNHGEGFYKQLGGKELPNAPKYTGTLTADYTLPLRGDWLITLHGDLHYQGESWARIFNTPGYDKLKAYTNLNLAAIFNNEDAGWRVMAYVKNVMDADSITGAFLNSDDTGLTTNVFLTEPRLYGIRVTKDWTGGTFLFGDGVRHEPGQPYPFTLELGAGVSQFSSDNETLAPAFVNTYQAPLHFPIERQDRDLDRGDQREVKLTYAAGGGWRASGAYRYGRTNGSTRDAVYEQLPDGTRTSLYIPPKTVEGPSNYGISEVHDGEEFTMADFMVSRDVGIGLLGDGGQSSVGLGLRYAHFASTSSVNLLGAPDWYWPAVEMTKYPHDSHSEYQSAADSDRRFEGIGPILSWEASKRLFDGDAVGHVDVDWTVTGGVLFGKQATDVEGASSGRFYHFPVSSPRYPSVIIDNLYNTPLESHRSDNVTVPTLGLSLGLSYAVGGLKVGTGYRWERYFDAIDGGISTSKQYDRTIDGPYLKVSIGFGG